MTCPLCKHTQSQPFYSDKKRDYLQCSRCCLVYVPSHQRLSAKEEKAIYDLHQNNVQDEGYCRFLSRLKEPLQERLVSNSTGLDFGCGPAPALANMLEQEGHKVALYDHYYQPNNNALNTTYDFITATEVIEHLYEPHNIWAQWLELLRPNGFLGIMTKLVKNVDAFSTWHYKNDQTHVCFFSRETFQFLAQQNQLQLEFIGNDVIILRKT